MKMKTICYILILLIFFLSGPAPGSEGRGDRVLRIGVSSSGFYKINPNDATAALKAWAAKLVKEQNLDLPIDVSYLSYSVNELQAALKENRLSAFSISVAEYMTLDLKAEAAFIPITNHGFETNYVIIIRKDSNVSNPKDLQGQNLVIGNDRRIDLARQWLQTLMADNDQIPDSSVFQELKILENPSKAILQVFFHQADAALVVKEAFNLACELNPQLRDNLKVIATSPPFVITIFIFADGFNHTKLGKELEKAILELHTTPGGQQLLTVFKSTRMGKYPISVLDNTIQFLTAYQSMTNKTSPQEVLP